MVVQNLNTLRIHEMTQAQYDREYAAGNIEANSIYLIKDGGNSGGNISVTPVPGSTVGYTSNSGYLESVPAYITRMRLTGTCTGYMSGGTVQFAFIKTLAGGAREVLDYITIASGDDSRISQVDQVLNIPAGTEYCMVYPQDSYDSGFSGGFDCNLTLEFAGGTLLTIGNEKVFISDSIIITKSATN